MRNSYMFIFVFFALTTSALATDDYTGTYVSDPQFGPVIVVLSQDAQGRVQGTMSGTDMELRIHGVREPKRISGTVSARGIQMKCMGELKGNQLLLKLIELNEYGQPEYDTAETLILRRQGSTVSRAPAPQPGMAQASSDRNVVINGTRLSNNKISSLERVYNIKISDGAYWYDKTCGAWGIQGGPTAGFILANLELGGPLKADASNGNTGVFVNGRHLHIYDVLALQQLLGTVLPGRYWLDAQGNVGIEGGAMLFNIVRLANVARSRRQGGTTYRSNITGIGAGSGGGASYVMGKDWAVMVGQ
jgi:hypothetical protein